MHRAHRFLVLLAILGGMLIPRGSTAIDTVTIGGDGNLDWQGRGTAPVRVIRTRHRSPLDPNDLLEGNSPGNLIEFEREDLPGSILPLRIEEGENVADGTIDRGGNIKAPNVFDFSGTFSRLDLKMALEELISSDPGGELLAFERKNLNALGILVILDMGARFGVERIRLYPRNTVQPSPSTPFQNDFLRSYELFINDGINLTRAGNQIWEPLVQETDNKDPVIDIKLDPPRFVQSIRLRVTSPVAFEIDELEVFGKGFLSSAQYLSDLYDAGQAAVWSLLRWREEIIGDPTFSSVQIRTRSGSDPNPFVFTRKLSGKPNAEEIPLSLADPTKEMELAEYLSLPRFDSQGRKWDPGPVKDDLINWSPFSAPYDPGAANGPGVPIVSPSPRRYFQFQAVFNSADLEAARVLRSLSFELLTPAFADQVVGEIFPRQVEVSRLLSFTYALRAVMRSSGLLGFDTVEIRTPVQVEKIEAVEIENGAGQIMAQHSFAGLDDTLAAGDFQILEVEDDHFAVRIPRVNEDNMLVRLRFSSRVLAFSTNFAASVRLASEPGVAQTALSGNAAILADEDNSDLSGTTVLSPSVLGGGRLLDEVRVVPEAFTPNGDGINDQAVVQYNLLSLSVPRPVEIGVYDLSGRRLRLIHKGPEGNGRYQDKSWDGRDAQGELVPPGTYIVRISVDGDSRQEERLRPVAVVY